MAEIEPFRIAEHLQTIVRVQLDKARQRETGTMNLVIEQSPIQSFFTGHEFQRQTRAVFLQQFPDRDSLSHT